MQHRVDADRQASQARSEAERHAAIRKSATSSLIRIASQLREEIVGSAPAVQQTRLPAGGWELRLSAATLSLAVNRGGDMSWEGWSAPPFDVVDAAWITLTVPADRFGYEGRSHALWYGDIQQLGQYRWYETAFMISPLIARQSKQAPFAQNPGADAAKAVWPGMAEFQVAWPFTPLEPDDLDEFIDRWADWFASAATGRPHAPVDDAGAVA